VSDSVTAPPSICLNMIVRNEVHIVAEVLDVVAPYISAWVIVDTGSDDGTQDLIRNHMAGLGIPGELYERPWHNFGHNRTEALALAQGRAEYILIMDADDTFVGTPDFTRLDADVYLMRYFGHGDVFWVPQLFRDGVRVRWKGVTHEYAVWDDSCVAVRLDGDYNIGDRHLSTRNLSGEKYVRDRDLLLAELERNPEDTRSAFYLAQSYFCLGDWVNARKWYARRIEMGGWAEEVGYSMYKLALSMEEFGEPWPDVQNAYLRAWEFRPLRAEGLHAIARRYRAEQRYQLGYLFAKSAAEIPFPEQETLFVRPDIYTWRIADEQAVCASWIDKHTEAFTLCRRLLARPDLPQEDRQRIARNRDVCAPTMIDAASRYPDTPLLQSLQHPAARDPEVVVSLIAGPDRASTELTLNSFLRCCTDVSRVGRFLVIDAGLSAQDRALLRDRYGFLEFAQPSTQLDQIRRQIDGRFWLHLGQGWQFFAPDDLITRLTAVLEAEHQVFLVGINFTDAVELTGTCAAEDAVRRTPDAGRYIPTDAPAHGPAMFDTARMDRAGGIQGTDPDPIAGLGRRAAAAGLRTASLDEVLCVGKPSATTASPPPS
jgi:glycosyltransferase involved in cell wall biosynthesis